MDHSPYSPDLLPSIFHAFGGPLKRTWPAGYLQQTPMWSKLSLPGCRHLTPTSSVLEYKFWCRLRQTIDYWQVWCVPSGMCRLYGDVKTCTITSEKSSRLWRVSCAIFGGFVNPDGPAIFLKVRLGRSSTSFVWTKLNTTWIQIFFSLFKLLRMNFPLLTFSTPS